MHAGLQWGEKGDSGYGCPHCRTCVFTDMCLNHTSLQIQYYRGADNAAPLFYDSKGAPHFTFPADFINTGGRLANIFMLHCKLCCCVGAWSMLWSMACYMDQFARHCLGW